MPAFGAMAFIRTCADESLTRRADASQKIYGYGQGARSTARLLLRNKGCINPQPQPLKEHYEFQNRRRIDESHAPDA